MQRLWIYGAGGHGRVIYEIINACGGFEIVGFIDDNEERSGENFLGYSLLTDKRKFKKINSELNVDSMMIAVGDNFLREQLSIRMTDFDFPTIIHSSAVISRDAEIGQGTIIMPGVVIEPKVVIGEHCIINNCCIIGHGSVVEDFCHISGNAVISGEVTVGKSSFVSIGACVTPQVLIGKKSILCAGSVVSKDVPAGAKMIGNPARNVNTYFTRDDSG